MKIDLETLKVVAEMTRPPQVKIEDKDSFATFTGGLRNNWPLVMALIGTLFYGVNQLSDINSTNIDQDRRIERNTSDISDLTSTVADFARSTDSRFDSTSSTNNEIIRRLDALQKDIEVIKGDK